jgi:hypothetical protein
MSYRFAICCYTLLGTIALTGCSSMFDGSDRGSSKKKKKETWSLFKKKEYQEPKSLFATWTEDTLTRPGSKTTRGFGGRLFFYNEKSQAIPVEGKLIVYGFDDTDAPNSNAFNAMSHAEKVASSPSDVRSVQAAKRFVFTPEQFTQHFSQGDLGASYSVWLPWDEFGGPKRKITLIPCFIAKDERLIRGEAMTLVLSGSQSIIETTQRSSMDSPLQPLISNGNGNNSSPVQLASATQPVMSMPSSMSNVQNPPSNRSFDVTTIRLGNSQLGRNVAPTGNADQLRTQLQQPSFNPALIQANHPAAASILPNPAPVQPVVSNGMPPVVGTLAPPSVGSMLPAAGHNLPNTNWMSPVKQ